MEYGPTNPKRPQSITCRLSHCRSVQLRAGGFTSIHIAPTGSLRRYDYERVS
jgi:hypothetical protein